MYSLKERALFANVTSGGHAKPALKRPQTECCWSDRLAELLREAGFDARREVRYRAAPRLRCDLQLTGPDGGRTWLEIKGAWKHWWNHERGSNGIYRAYLLDRFHLDPGATGVMPLGSESPGSPEEQPWDGVALAFIMKPGS